MYISQERNSQIISPGRLTLSEMLHCGRRALIVLLVDLTSMEKSKHRAAAKKHALQKGEATARTSMLPRSRKTIQAQRLKWLSGLMFLLGNSLSDFIPKLPCKRRMNLCVIFKKYSFSLQRKCTNLQPHGCFANVCWAVETKMSQRARSIKCYWIYPIQRGRDGVSFPPLMQCSPLNTISQVIYLLSKYIIAS